MPKGGKGRRGEEVGGRRNRSCRTRGASSRTLFLLSAMILPLPHATTEHAHAIICMWIPIFSKFGCEGDDFVLLLALSYVTEITRVTRRRAGGGSGVSAPAVRPCPAGASESGGAAQLTRPRPR
eukprot:753895-Hanusia_phi.AAC.1